MNERDLKVLEKYELQIIRTCRGRASFLCEGKQQLYLLREYEASEKRAEEIQNILLTVSQNRDIHVDCFVRNMEGQIITRDRERRSFVVREWYRGRECDVKKESEVLLAVEQLAGLHRQLRELPEKTMMQQSLTCGEEFSKRMKELKSIRNYVMKKKGKTEFEQMFLNCFEDCFEQAEQAAEYTHDFAENEKWVCHGDFNQHNILFGHEGIYIVNFDRCHMGSQTEDLYHFMRKVLEKYDWNVDLGRKILETYERIRPLSDGERSELYARFYFPEKYWKIANHYYNARKVWGVERNLSKLEKMCAQASQKEIFLRSLCSQSPA